MKFTVAKKMALLIGSALLGIVLLTGLSQQQMNKVFDAANYGNINSVPSLRVLSTALEEFGRIRVRAYRHALNTDSTAMVEIESKLKDAQVKLDKALEDYASLISDDKDKAFLATDKALRDEYTVSLNKILEMSRSNNNEQARDLLTKAGPLAERLNEALDEHMQYNIDLGNKGADGAIAAKSSALTLSLIITFLTIGVVAIIGFTVTRAFQRQLGGEPDAAVDIANKIAVGDLSAKIELKEGDATSLMAALKRMTVSIQALGADAAVLSTAAVEGRLETRADAGKHQGDFRKIVEGVNDTLDAVIGPLNVTADYVDNIAKGVIPSVITDNYNGDFNVIKNNLNNVVKMMSDLLAQTDIIIRAAADGELDKRANAESVPGRLEATGQRRQRHHHQHRQPAECDGRLRGSNRQGRHPASHYRRVQRSVQRHQEQPEQCGQDDERPAGADRHHHPAPRQTANWTPAPTPNCSWAAGSNWSAASTTPSPTSSTR